MDDVIHDNEPPRAGSVLGPAEEGIHEHGHVVIPVVKNHMIINYYMIYYMISTLLIDDRVHTCVTP